MKYGRTTWQCATSLVSHHRRCRTLAHMAFMGTFHRSLHRGITKHTINKTTTMVILIHRRLVSPVVSPRRRFLEHRLDTTRPSHKWCRALTCHCLEVLRLRLQWGRLLRVPRLRLRLLRRRRRQRCQRRHRRDPDELPRAVRHLQQLLGKCGLDCGLFG